MTLIATPRPRCVIASSDGIPGMSMASVVSSATAISGCTSNAVVCTGPYRWIRHPSYSGLLLIVGGFGAALGNWLSLTACVVLPLPAIVWRIHVEEAELNRVLGEAYRTYQSDRARLIPHLW